MGEEIKELLEEEIKSEIENLSSLEAGSQQHSAAVESLAKLYKLKIEEDKSSMDYYEKEESRNTEIDIKRNQMDEAVKDRYFRLGIAAAELILPLMFYGIWMNRGFKFEKDGTYTSQTFRGLFSPRRSSLLPLPAKAVWA